MKLIFIGFITFLWFNMVCARDFISDLNLQFTDFNSEGLQTGSNLFNENLFKNNSHGIPSKQKVPLVEIASGTAYVFAALSGNNNSWDEGLKMNIKTRTLISAGLFIPTVATGYLMRGSTGDPNDAWLTVHKLSSVSNLILLDATTLKKRKFTSLTWAESLVAITMTVSFAFTITTGSLQSVGRTMPGWVNTSHQTTPWVTILSSGVLLYLLNG